MPAGTVIASGHPATTEAAAHAIRSGGNAFDAILSGWLVSCLAEPVLTSPAGGGFAMVAPTGGRPRLYDFFTQTPQTRNPDGHSFPLEADFGSTRQVFHLGPATVATPGCVAGILRLQKDFGRLPIKACTESARELCRKGLVITPHAATLFQVVSALYRATPASRSLFSSNILEDTLLCEGEVFRNPDFAHFLDMLELEGARWFYAGDIGRLVSDLCRDNGGHLTRRDFETYQATIRDPLEIRHAGSTIWLNPPPSMGGTLIAAGLITGNTAKHDPYPFRKWDSWRDWIAPVRLMSLLRSSEGSQHLDVSTLEALQACLQANRPLQQAFSLLFPHAWNRIHATGTTQLSIIDREGNAVAMTTSNGAGSGIILKSTGFMLNNMLGEEDLQPGGMGSWMTDQRLSSMMAPTLARLADGTLVATGSGGSNRIRSTILQVLRHLVERGASLEEAIAAPRVHWESGELHAESAACRGLQELASSLPWPLVEHRVPNLFFGGCHSVSQGTDQTLMGMADPRRGGVSCTVPGT